MPKGSPIRPLIGRPHVFERELSDMVVNHQPIYTDSTILNIQRLSSRGLSKFYDLLTEIDGYIALVASPRFIIDRVLGHVCNGQLVAKLFLSGFIEPIG